MPTSWLKEVVPVVGWTLALKCRRRLLIHEYAGTVGGERGCGLQTGLLLQLTGNGNTLTFYASALIYAAGALCWRFIDSTNPVSQLVTLDHLPRVGLREKKRLPSDSVKSRIP